MRYPTFLSLIIKFPIQMALGCIQYGPTQRKMSMFFSVKSHAFHNIPLKSQRFWRLKHLQPQRFPHSAKPRPLSQCKRGYLFFSLTNTQTTRVIPFYPHPTKSDFGWWSPYTSKPWDQVMYDLAPQTPEPPGITIVATGLRKSRHQLVHWRDTPCWIVLHCPLAHPVRNPVLKEWCFLSKIGKT